MISNKEILCTTPSNFPVGSFETYLLQPEGRTKKPANRKRSDGVAYEPTDPLVCVCDLNLGGRAFLYEYAKDKSRSY